MVDYFDMHRCMRLVGFGGGWGYTCHSVEAIQVCVSTDVLLGGLGLFGGRGQYSAKVKVSLYHIDWLKNKSGL